MLEYLVIKAFYDDSETADMDAATTQDGHVVSGLWNGWKEMGILIVGPDDWRLGVMAAAARCTYVLRKSAKRVLGPARHLLGKAGRHGRNWAKPVPLVIGIAALCAE